jgi:hypothetical protein
MGDLIAQAGPYILLAAFTLAGFVLVAWRWWGSSGGLGRWSLGGLALLTAALFVILLVWWRNANPDLGLAEVIGFSIWGALFLVGSGAVIWLRYKGRSRR